MALGEIYIKLVVSFPNDPKVRALARYGADAGLARDLYVQMCLYCKDMLSDGLVPFEQVGLLVYPLEAEHGNQLAKQLASVGLTKEEASGWQVVAFCRRNGTREDVERLSQVRAEAGRTGGRKSRKRPGQKASQANRKQVGYQGAEQAESNTVSVSANAETETQQTPTASAADINIRAKPITDAYHAAQPMCRWPAINGVVIHGIKSGKYTDDLILAAILRLAESGQTVTVESLRLEIEGFPPRDRSTGNGTAVDRRQQATNDWTEGALQRAAAREGTT